MSSFNDNMDTNHTLAPALDAPLWYTSDTFATGCVAVVLTLLVSMACYQARSRHRLLRRHPAPAGTSL